MRNHPTSTPLCLPRIPVAPHPTVADKEIAARTAAAQLATPPASPQRLPAQAAVPAQAATLQQQVPASQQADLECLRETAATWEERAREAEHRTEAAVRAADAAAAAAVRLADRRTSAAEAKARAAILEAQVRVQGLVGRHACRLPAFDSQSWVTFTVHGMFWPGSAGLGECPISSTWAQILLALSLAVAASAAGSGAGRRQGTRPGPGAGGRS